MEKITKKYIVEETIKCKQDCIYFIKKYCYIEHPIKGKIKFDDIWDYQVNAINDFMNNRFTIVLKSRQTGFSTTVAAYCSWLIQFFPNQKILIIATKSETAKNIIRKVDVIIKNMPKWLQSKPIVDNTFSKELENGSLIKAIGNSEDAGRSESLSLLIIDEAAFIEKMDELWPGLYNTLSTGGNCIAISTPNGVGNWYHTTWINSLQSKNEFKRIEVPWWLHPERNDEWKEQQLKNDPKFNQEHELEFLTTGKSFISLKFLNDVYKINLHTPNRIEYDENLFIWEDPDIHYKYVIPVDTATGDGSDDSALLVLKLPNQVNEKVKCVASYAGKIPPEQIGRLAFNLGLKYNDALIVPENTGIGFATVRELINLGCMNLFQMKSDLLNDFDKDNKEQQKIYSAKFGFSNNSRSRPIIMDKTYSYFMNEHWEFYDERIYQQFETFAYINGKPQALNGYHDDLVICAAIGLWAQEYFANIFRTEREFLNVMQKTYEKTEGTFEKTYKQTRTDYSEIDMDKPESYLWVLSKG